MRGDYRLSEKLTVSGTAYKQVDLFRLDHQNPSTRHFDYQGIIMGVNYQLGDNFFIHGEVEFSNGYNRLYNTPHFYQNQFRRDPFQSTPFKP